MFTRLRNALARIGALAGTDRLDRDFQDELASHLDMLTDENVRRGMTPSEARRAARIRLGNPEALRVRHRDARGLPAVEAVVRDVRFALRLLRTDRWFTAAAVVTLALGIGVNATGFTIVSAAFLRGLPFENAERLYVLSWQPRHGRRSPASYPDLQDWRMRSRTFEGLAAYRSRAMSLADDRGQPREVRGASLTANAFDLIGAHPILGRGLLPRDERQGAEPVAVIGEGLWMGRYAGDRGVLGRLIALNGQTATIVGVMPADLKFPNNTEVWLPLIPAVEQQRRDARSLAVVGLLRRGETRASARAELNAIAQGLFAAYPDASRDLAGVRVETFTEAFIGGAARPMLLAVMGAGCCVLLIACANVANLLLSRSIHRRREIAVRRALGASRARVVGQLLIESAVLGLAGGALGLLLTIWGVHAFAGAIDDPGRPFWIRFDVDYVVFAYVAAICLATAVAAGLAPALQMSRPPSGDVLKEGARGTTASVRTRWLSGAMIVTELALSVVLLVGAGLMFRSFLNVAARDVGIRTDRLTMTDVRLLGDRYSSAEARRSFFDRLDVGLAELPGVESASLTTGVPPLDGGERRMVLDGSSADQPRPFVSVVTIGPRYFDSIGVGLVRGRMFRNSDGATAQGIALVSQPLAAKFFAGADPIGRRIRLTRPDAPAEASPWLTVVGIGPALRQGSLQDLEPGPVVYTLYRQDPPTGMTMLVRGDVAPLGLSKALRHDVDAIDRNQPISPVRTFDEAMEQSRWPYRLFSATFGLFGIIALVLSAVGLYGVMSYAVAQRTHEIGVRVALGATWRQIRWLVLRRSLLQLTCGLTIGVVGALGASRVLANMLVGVGSADPITYAAIALLLALVCVLACLVPARRAARVDPLIAIREG